MDDAVIECGWHHNGKIPEPAYSRKRRVNRQSPKWVDRPRQGPVEFGVRCRWLGPSSLTPARTVIIPIRPAMPAPPLPAASFGKRIKRGSRLALLPHQPAALAFP